MEPKITVNNTTLVLKRHHQHYFYCHLHPYLITHCHRCLPHTAHVTLSTPLRSPPSMTQQTFATSLLYSRNYCGHWNTVMNQSKCQSQGFPFINVTSLFMVFVAIPNAAMSSIIIHRAPTKHDIPGLELREAF